MNATYETVMSERSFAGVELLRAMLADDAARIAAARQRVFAADLAWREMFSLPRG